MATFDGLLNRAALNTFFIGFTGDKLSCYLDLNHCNPPSLTSVKTRELLGYSSCRDGIHIGSGRPAGSNNRATAGIKEGLSGLSKNHTVEVLGVIVALMYNSMSDNVRLAPAYSLLHRGYGKP
mgnify:CR=1 FL=1|jgi:hypothetical protein|tara:strand:+ start:23 stop:391 length:369 start_codon:yes stop_codon:yes gene_type:complete